MYSIISKKSLEVKYEPKQFYWFFKNISRIQITIHEGKNREVRKMCAAIGKRVLALHRCKIGNLGVKDLKLGTWRYLTKKEVEMFLKNER